MSGQQSQRVRKNVSPAGAAAKQGPMRAIVPLSLMQTCSPTRCLKSSPSNSPPVNWSGDNSKVKTRLSPDNRISPESQAAQSPGCRGEKSVTLGKVPPTGQLMRRTASVDTIYLLGQWQRDALYLSYCGRLMMDRATQTPEEFEEMDRRLPLKKSSAVSNETLEMKLIRQRLHRSRPCPPQRQSPVQGDHCAGAHSPLPSVHPRALPIPIPDGPAKPPPRMRSSVEGLNQEIERIVLREISGAEGEDSERLLDGGFRTLQPLEPTPEGHRAPIADLFRHSTQASVDTQTPFDRGDSCHSSNSSGSHSVSPIAPGHMDGSRPSSDAGSKGSGSPELEGTHKMATSPHINKFLAREPPDGCEKVKIAEENRNSAGAGELHCPKPSMNFVLLPSQRSAFDPLCKNCGAFSTPNGDILKPGAPPAKRPLQ